MLKPLVYFILMISIISCDSKSDKSIGKEISNDKFELKEHIKDSIVKQWNEYLKTNNIESRISELNITKEKDTETQKEYYSIIGETDNNQAVLRIEIEHKNDKLIYFKSEFNSLVICYGSNNCFPKLNNGNWNCYDGTKTNICSKNCQKLELAIVASK